MCDADAMQEIRLQDPCTCGETLVFVQPALQHQSRTVCMQQSFHGLGSTLQVYNGQQIVHITAAQLHLAEAMPSACLGNALWRSGLQ
jgi:hypothetical protein